MAQNFLFRSSHFALLATAPFELVHKFWQSVPPLCIDGRELSPLQIVERISRKGNTPTQYLFEVNRRIERFCCDHDLDFGNVRRAIGSFSSKHSGFHEEVFPLLDKAFHLFLRGVSSHIIECMFDRVGPVIRTQLETFEVEILYKQKERGLLRYFDAADIRNEDGSPADFDFDSYLFVPLCGVPTYFDRPRLSSAAILADQRALSMILWPENNHEVKDGILLIGGKRYGREMPFSAFLESCTPKPDIGRIPLRDDPPVMVVERPFVCPVRRRTVLEPGRAVAAPYWLHAFEVPRKATPPPEEAERHHEEMLRYAVRDAPWGLKRFMELNHAFLVYLRGQERAEVIYHESRESMTVNGRQVVRSIPARLLRKMLENYSREEKTAFEYWEFMHDEQVILNKESHHLSRRIDRLADALRKKTDLFVLRRPRRGWVTLEVKRPFTFRIDR